MSDDIIQGYMDREKGKSMLYVSTARKDYIIISVVVGDKRVVHVTIDKDQAVSLARQLSRWIGGSQ